MVLQSLHEIQMPELKVDIYLPDLVASVKLISTMRDRNSLNSNLACFKQLGRRFVQMVT
jgi:hypothetical protein